MLPHRGHKAVPESGGCNQPYEGANGRHLCVAAGNSAATGCSEVDFRLQPNQAEDYSLFTEVRGQTGGRVDSLLGLRGHGNNL